MTIIDRYIFKSIFQTTLIVLFVFIAFSGFIDFVSQTDDIGTGNYGVTEAIQYTILKLPSSIFKLLSIIVLIGSLLGLGNLSKNNELKRCKSIFNLEMNDLYATFMHMICLVFIFNYLRFFPKKVNPTSYRLK